MNNLDLDDLIKKLTLDEKLSLLSGKDFWQTQDIPRLGIPSIYLSDGPHGVRRQSADAGRMGLNRGIPATCFPTEATVANSWNVELGEKVGQFLGHEARDQGVSVLLGPGINIKRNPLCGRNFEYFSEDPYLAGKMAAAYIRGIHSQGIAACAKHFAVSNQEWRIMSIDTVVDERALREIYLTAFEIAVKEGGARALMSAYNKVNGTHANENTHLMVDILRKEWGYRGCVVTNWGGSNDRVAGLKAGNELEMPGSRGDSEEEIRVALARGDLDEATIDANLERLLNLVFTTATTSQGPHIDFNVAQHHRVSQRVAEESIVLLKNEDAILPLGHSTKVAVIGDFAAHARYQGAGSSQVNPTILDNTLDCFDESGITSIGYEPGFDRYGHPSPAKIDRACALAAKADVVLLYLGLDELSEAQGLDRPSMGLPNNQIALLEALYTVNRRIVVVLSCGSAIEMPWLGKVKGLLHAYLSGQAGARAILRVISGDVNPSGKLAESYPLRYEDTPSAAYFPGNDLTVEYRESLFVGYRYFQTTGMPVQFPFGFGLSYTTFSYQGITVDPQGVSFDLTNTGTVPGMEVPQLYIGKPDSALIRPVQELKGFTKVLINPGQTKRITLPFNHLSFRYYSTRDQAWRVEPGEYRILVGSSCAHIHLSAPFRVPDRWTWHDAVPATETALPSYRAAKVARVDAEEFSRLLGRPLPPTTRDRNRPLGHEDPISQCRHAAGWFGRLGFRSIRGLHGLLGRIGRRDLANLIMMSVYHLPFRNIARLTGGRITMGMVDGLLLMVNGHMFRGTLVLIRAWIHALAKERRSRHNNH